jgi:hypothetical protein
MNRELIERATHHILTISQLLKHIGATMTMLTFALLLLPTTTRAQSPTPLEQQCMTAVQGKVAWNQAGNKTWSEANLRNLCQGTTNPSATISCFQNEIRSHNDWNRAITACKAKPASNQPAATPGAVKLPGTARDIDAKNGVVYVIGSNAVPGGYGLWKLVNAGWVQVPPGGGVRVAVEPAGTPWVIDNAGIVKRLVGANWVSVATEKKAIDLAFDTGGRLWVILEDGRVMNSWDLKTFKEELGSPKNALRLTALTYGYMLVTTTAKKDYVALYQSDPPTFVCAGPGGVLRSTRECLSIAAGYIENVFDTADGTQWAIDSSLAIWKIKAK